MFDFTTEQGQMDTVIGILLHHYKKEELSEFYGISPKLINIWMERYRRRALEEIKKRQICFNGQSVKKMKPLLSTYRPTSGAVYIDWKHIR